MRNKSSQVTTALQDHHQYYVTVPVLLPASMLVPLLVPISLSVLVELINPLVPAAILVLAIIVVIIPSKLEVAPYALKMLDGVEWIPLRLLRLLEHLRC